MTSERLNSIDGIAREFDSATTTGVSEPELTARVREAGDPPSVDAAGTAAICQFRHHPDCFHPVLRCPSPASV